MHKLVSVMSEPKSASKNLKYVQQTYDAMKDSSINLELIAIQIGQLPVREQKKFFRLLLNYIDITSNLKNPMMHELIELSERIVELVNNYYEEQEANQLQFEGM